MPATRSLLFLQLDPLAIFLLVGAGMRTLRLALVATLATFGCTDSSTSSIGDPEKSDFASKEFDCMVVEVLDSNVLEEGLGSIYDYDSDGFPSADGDSISVSLRKSDLSAIESKMILSVGQLSIGLHDAGDTVKRVTETGVITWEGQLAREAPTEFNPEPVIPDVFRVRIIRAIGVGWVQTKAADGTLNDVAKIDCRPGVAAPDFDALN